VQNVKPTTFSTLYEVLAELGISPAEGSARWSGRADRDRVSSAPMSAWAPAPTEEMTAFVELDGTNCRVYFAALVETAAKPPHRDGWATRARVKLLEP
jgi:hypothetical protein